MTKVKIRRLARKKNGLETQRSPGEIPSRLRGEFFTDSYAKIFEEEGRKLYRDILTELVGGKKYDDSGGTAVVKGKLPELFEEAVARLTNTLKHKKGIDGLKDNAQFFAPWIKGLVDDVRTTGMRDIMKSLESLAHDHSVRVVDEQLLEQPLPDLGMDEKLDAEDMALPEAAEVPEIPDLSSEDVEGMLKGDESAPTAVQAPPVVAPAAPLPAGGAPGAPMTPQVPAPQAAAANTIKGVRRKLLERREQRQVVAAATPQDLVRSAEATLKGLDDA